MTPTVLHNWNETAGGDMDLVDGYEELPKEIQDKVKLALEERHVDDDEWNGVRETASIFSSATDLYRIPR